VQAANRISGSVCPILYTHHACNVYKEADCPTRCMLFVWGHTGYDSQRITQLSPCVAKTTS
jgi:hypothetical protein